MEGEECSEVLERKCDLVHEEECKNVETEKCSTVYKNQCKKISKVMIVEPFFQSSLFLYILFGRRLVWTFHSSCVKQIRRKSVKISTDCFAQKNPSWIAILYQGVIAP